MKQRFNDPVYDEQLWNHLKESKEIDREGLQSLISKLDYKPGEVDEQLVAGSLVITLIRLSMKDRLSTGEVGFDFDKDRSALLECLSLGTYGLNQVQLENLVDNLRAKILSFGTREIRFVDKGKFVVKNEGTKKTVFYRDEDLYRRPSRCYQPDITCDDIDETNPPRGGSGFVPAQ